MKWLWATHCNNKPRPSKRQCDAAPTCTALMMAMMPVGQKQQTVVSTAMGR